MRADGTVDNIESATSCTSASTAMNVKTHNKESFEPGDKILLCDNGGIYKSSIIVPSSGSDDKPIVYRNADGDRPVIDLSMDIGSSCWKDMGNGVYRKKGYGRVFWEDGIPLKAASDETLKDGDWFYPSGSHKLYYKPTSGTPSDHTIETIWFDMVWAPYAIDLRNRSHIEIAGLNIRRVGGGIGHGSIKKSPVRNITDIVIHNNNIRECMWGIWSQVFKNGVESDVKIHNNKISYCNSGISAWTGSSREQGHTQHHKRYTISHNKILNLYSITEEKVWSDALLKSHYYTDHEGISFQDVQDSVISDNVITTTYSKDMTSDQYWSRAIYLYLTNGDSPTTGNKVLRNKISGHYNPSIYISTARNFEGFEDNIFAYNSIHYALSDKGQASFEINAATNNPLSGKNYFVNNTIVNDSEGLGIWFYGKMAGNWVVKNNIIKSPLLVKISEANLSGNIEFNNNIYLANASWGFLQGAAGLQFAVWQKTGQDNKSRKADPNFVSKDDFHLRPDSPAIDAGKSIEVLEGTKDLDGNPISGKPDMGAYEYQK